VLRGPTDDDLQELGVAALGHRKQRLEAIAELREPAGRPAATANAGAPATSPRKAERRQLTVLFCDLVGSTELSARLDPEDLGAVMRSYQNRCAEVVRRWDGFVARYLGDGVLAYFGCPQAHEDDAERAVRAGLELVAAVGRLTAGEGEPLAARVGIATGRVVVGDLIGQGAAQEQAVVGETPNLAARLQELATPGAVVVAESTRQLLGALFEMSDLGAHALKGLAAQVAAWRVIGASRAETRFEAAHDRRLSTLVGREQEVELLVERWHRAAGGEGPAPPRSSSGSRFRSGWRAAMRAKAARAGAHGPTRRSTTRSTAAATASLSPQHPKF
jgi:class 3 adenylate cyclase